MTNSVSSQNATTTLYPFRFVKLSSTGWAFATNSEGTTIDVDAVTIPTRTIMTSGLQVDAECLGVLKVEIKTGESFAIGDLAIPSTDGDGKAVKDTTNGYKVTSVQSGYINVIVDGPLHVAPAA